MYALVCRSVPVSRKVDANSDEDTEMTGSQKVFKYEDVSSIDMVNQAIDDAKTNIKDAEINIKYHENRVKKELEKVNDKQLMYDELHDLDERIHGAAFDDTAGFMGNKKKHQSFIVNLQDGSTTPTTTAGKGQWSRNYIMDVMRRMPDDSVWIQLATFPDADIQKVRDFIRCNRELYNQERNEIDINLQMESLQKKMCTSMKEYTTNENDTDLQDYLKHRRKVLEEKQTREDEKRKQEDDKAKNEEKSKKKTVANEGKPEEKEKTNEEKIEDLKLRLNHTMQSIQRLSMEKQRLRNETYTDKDGKTYSLVNHPLALQAESDLTIITRANQHAFKNTGYQVYRITARRPEVRKEIYKVNRNRQRQKLATKQCANQGGKQCANQGANQGGKQGANQGNNQVQSHMAKNPTLGLGVSVHLSHGSSTPTHGISCI
eukprot:766331-Hanusia_phi.AAC.2